MPEPSDPSPEPPDDGKLPPPSDPNPEPPDDGKLPPPSDPNPEPPDDGKLPLPSDPEPVRPLDDGIFAPPSGDNPWPPFDSEESGVKGWGAAVERMAPSAKVKVIKSTNIAIGLKLGCIMVDAVLFAKRLVLAQQDIEHQLAHISQHPQHQVLNFHLEFHEHCRCSPGVWNRDMRQ